MKRLLFFLLFFALFAVVLKFTIPKPVTETATPPVQKQIKENGFYGLWKSEAKSKTLNPKELSEIKKMDAKSKEYSNNLFGYRFFYPSDWQIDNHQVPNYTRLFSNDFRVDITVQSLDDIWIKSDEFISKTTANLSENKINDKTFYIKNWKVRDIDYKRNEIKQIKNDENFYSYYFLTKNNIVYTFQLKTDENSFPQKKQDLEKLISSFVTFTPQTFDLNSTVTQKDLNKEINLKQESKSLIIPKNNFLMGIFTLNSFDIDSLSKKIQSPIGSQMIYKPIDSIYDNYIKVLTDQNRLPVITFLYEETNKDNNKEVVENILKGKYDKNLNSWIQGIKSVKSPVFIRLGNEMNGDWSDWSYKNTYNDPDLYKLSFNYIVNMFRKNGANNAYFVWNPNSVSSPYYTWNYAQMYYPGDKAVDFVGITSYNFGFDKFQTFDSQFNDIYLEYSRSFSGKPLIIGETGSVEDGGSKANWINNLFQSIPEKYPNIKMAIWFNAIHDKYNFNIDTSQASLNAFQKGMKNANVVKGLANSN